MKSLRLVTLSTLAGLAAIVQIACSNSIMIQEKPADYNYRAAAKLVSGGTLSERFGNEQFKAWDTNGDGKADAWEYSLGRDIFYLYSNDTNLSNLPWDSGEARKPTNAERKELSSYR